MNALLHPIRWLDGALGTGLVLLGYLAVITLDKAYALAGRLDAEQEGQHWD